ncbi:ATPase [Streptomyces sp. NRRL F-4707]|uniref:RapZ C-terminal domain-containing protein n=1 Tax=Streptomyces sp. NRRL F-4707 TaxID=1519496 RepID=UPI0006AE077D|nr:RNase adapter RapZ [Streptomyces sp. NRRL F-4707]KOX32822.1 ATPase [Streptomyces sp. NRRL F-4707]
MTATITSFGYLHGAPPAAHLTLDLRRHFRDPHVSPVLRHMTAHDSEVRQAVLGTPGIPALVEAISDAVVAYLNGPGGRAVNVAVGCAGGRHRAAVVAEAIRTALADENVTASVVHRDLERPVVDR